MAYAVFVSTYVPISMPDDRNSETTIPVEIRGPLDTIFPCQQRPKEIRSKQRCTCDSTLQFISPDLQFKLAQTHKQKQGFMGSNNLKV